MTSRRLKNRSIASLLATLLLQASMVLADGSTIVSHFVDAFNSHDIDAMLQHATDDIRWISVARDGSVVEAAGHDELRTSMTEYFRSVPTARSELRSAVLSGPFVHAVEQAFWSADGVEKNQCSVSVYEIDGGRIKTVWYFPAFECPHK